MKSRLPAVLSFVCLLATGVQGVTLTPIAEYQGDCGMEVAFSPDGRTLLSSGVERVTLWDLATGKKKCVLEHDSKDPLVFAKWSPTGSRVVTATKQECCVWDSTSGKRLQTFKLTEQIWCADWDSGGDRIALGSDGGVSLLNVISGEREAFAIHSNPVVLVRFSPPHHSLLALSLGPTKERTHLSREPSVVVGGNAAIHLWNETLSAELVPDWPVDSTRRLNGSFQSFADERVDNKACDVCRVWSQAAVFDASGGRIASIFQGDVVLRSAQTGRQLLRLKDSAEGVGETGSLQFSPDGNLIVAAGGGTSDLSAKVWNLSSQQSTMLFPVNASINPVFSPSGKLVLLAGPTKEGVTDAWDGTQNVRFQDGLDGTGIWELPAGVRRYAIRAKTKAGQKETPAAAFDREGRHLAVGYAADRTIRVWKVEE